MNRRIFRSALVALSLLALPVQDRAQDQPNQNPRNEAPSVPQAVAPQAVVPRLPQPAGPFGIGRVGYDWVDSSRPDRYASDAHTHRELMVYLWYPAAQKVPNVHGAYLPGVRAMDANPDIRRSQQAEFEATWPAVVSGEVFSHVVEHAAPAKSPHRFPVILFSHGSGGSGFESTSLIEDLVSRGYIVAAIEHTELARVVYFPDGRLVPAHWDPPQPGLSRDEQFKRMMAQAAATMVEGAADVRFVLDQLTQLNHRKRPQDPLAGRLDLDQVVAMGHSAGAAFAVRACQVDPRFKACVDLDGAMVPISALPDFGDGATLKQPLLFLEAYYPESRMFGTHEQHQVFFQKKESQFAACASGSYDVTLHPPDFFHGSFSDYPLLVAANPAAAERAQRNLQLVETFVRAFLHKTLQHAPEPVLDDPAARPSEADVRSIGH